MANTRPPSSHDAHMPPQQYVHQPPPEARRYGHQVQFGAAGIPPGHQQFQEPDIPPPQLGRHQFVPRPRRRMDAPPRDGWSLDSLWRSFTETGSTSLGVGVGAVVTGGLTLLVVKTTQAAFRSVPSIWGTIPAGAIIGVTTFVALPTSKKVATQPQYQIATTAFTVFLSTALFTPKLSSTICPHRVGYIGAATYGILGGIVSGFACYANAEMAKEKDKELANEHRAEMAEEDYLDYEAIEEYYQVQNLAHQVQDDPTLATINEIADNPKKKAQVISAIETQLHNLEIAKQVFRLFDANAQLEILIQMERGNDSPFLFQLEDPEIIRILSPVSQRQRELVTGRPPSREESRRIQRILAGLPQSRPPVRPNDWGDYGRMALLSGVAGAVVGVVASVFLGFGTFSTYMSEKFPVLKGAGSVGIVGGVSVFVAGLTLSQKPKEGIDLEEYDMEEYDPDDFEYKSFDLITRAVAVFALTVALTPTASKYISNYQVGYLQTAGLSLAAVGGAAGLGIGGLFIANLLHDK